jgi:hypothetical protein
LTWPRVGDFELAARVPPEISHPGTLIRPSSCRLLERSQTQTIACATTPQKTGAGFTADPND